MPLQEIYVLKSENRKTGEIQIENVFEQKIMSLLVCEENFQNDGENEYFIEVEVIER